MIKVVGKRKGTISTLVTEIVQEFGLEKEDITIVSKKTRHKHGYYAYAWHNFFVPMEAKNNTLRPKAASAAPAAMRCPKYKVVLHSPITDGSKLGLWKTFAT